MWIFAEKKEEIIHESYVKIKAETLGTLQVTTSPKPWLFAKTILLEKRAINLFARIVYWWWQLLRDLFLHVCLWNLWRFG